MNYEQDIRIDDTALDVEWLEQPSLMFKYAKHSAFCAAKMETLKQQLDLIKAALDKRIRATPEKFEIEKITEAAVSNTILSQPEYQEIEEQYREARHDYEIARAAVNAITTRKDALENLVRLHGMQYFAGPKMPRNLTQERQERELQQKKIDAGIGAVLSRKTITKSNII